MEKLAHRAMELARCYGAVAVGIATVETLAGGPPSTDLTYVLPNARSAEGSVVIKASEKNTVCWRGGFYG